MELTTTQLKTIVNEELENFLGEVLRAKSLFIFDFDDTIARTDSKVFLVRDGERIVMDSPTFAKYEYQEGDELDFSDFNRVDADIIPQTLAILDDAMDKGHKVAVVTARSPGAIEGIKAFFRQNGMTPPNIYATAGSEGKPPVLRDLLQQGTYGRVIVYEDCRKNIESLKPVADEMGVPYTAICVDEKAQMRKVYENDFKNLIREELSNFLEELSKEEEKFFGDEIKALVDNPDELYYVKTVKPRNPYVDSEERQFLNRRWIEDNVGRYMGGGSFRDAYQIKSHPDKILKISNRFMQHEPLDGQEYTTIAEDTNALEIELFNKYPGYFPKVYISDKEKKGIPRWLVIEKVKVIEYESEFVRQLVRSFKSIPKSYNLVNKLIAEFFPSTTEDFPPALGTGRNIDPEEYAHRSWLAVGYNDKDRLKDILKDLPVWDEKYGDVINRSVDRVIDEEVLLDEVVEKAWKVLTSDQYLIKFWDMVNDLHIAYAELRPGNLGTDFETRTKFLIIDISIFED